MEDQKILRIIFTLYADVVSGTTLYAEVIYAMLIVADDKMVNKIVDKTMNTMNMTKFE